MEPLDILTDRYKQRITNLRLLSAVWACSGVRRGVTCEIDTIDGSSELIVLYITVWLVRKLGC